MDGLSYGAAARILGISKSEAFNKLTYISQIVDRWDKIIGATTFSGTLCIDEKYIRVAELKETKGKSNFAYLFFAIDPDSGDLLHIDLFPSRNNDSIILFLNSLKKQGIFPNVIMTDLLVGYDSAIKEVYGRSVTISKCHFHFKQNIFRHMNEQFGKKNIPDVAYMLKQDIFLTVDFKSKKTIRECYQYLQKIRPQYLRKEPKLSPMFNCLDNYITHLLRVIEHENVHIYTNNACELAIRRFNQLYKNMSGFSTLETAQRHAKLFQIYYRFTTYTQDAQKHKRGKAPLQVAGYKIDHMPIFQYLNEPLLFNLQPAKNLTLCQQLKIS